jgi:hypothetical protein
MKVIHAVIEMSLESRCSVEEPRQKATGCVTPLHKILRIGKPRGTECRLVVAKSLGRGVRTNCLRGIIFSFGMMKMFWN